MSMISGTGRVQLEGLTNWEFADEGVAVLVVICISVELFPLQVENGRRWGLRFAVIGRKWGSRFEMMDMDNGFFIDVNFTEIGERLVWIGFLF